MPKAVDFLPSRYSKTSKKGSSIKTDPQELDAVPNKKIKTPTTPFAGLGDDDSKEIPNYSVAKMTEASKKETKKDSVPNNSNPKKENKINTPQSKKRKNNITGLAALLFLVVGVAASYFLINQNQDLRQQARIMECDPSWEPYCVCDGNICTYEYPEDPTPTGNSCPTGYYYEDGHCYHNSCKDGICGGSGDGDPCTQDSYGGDWCDDPTTAETETCGDMGLIRCKCGPGDDTGWWVIGEEGQSCNELCDDAGIDCSDCPPETTPTDRPTGTPTGTPTATPTPIACGDTGCQINDDCASGLTCQEVSIDNQTVGICALGANQLFCAAEPNEANCCEDVAMPVCNSIDMLNANNTLMSEDDDKNLSLGDQVKFQCSARGTLSVDFDYKFRILTPSGLWIDLTDNNNVTAKNVSAPYTISEYGPFVAQAQICVEDDCQGWETVPSVSSDHTNCETDADCSSGQTCYQPPMPTCPAGVSCIQVMPDKYCVEEVFE